MPKRFGCGGPFPPEQPRTVQLSGREEVTGAIMKLDTKGEMFCWICGAAELRIDTDLQRRGKSDLLGRDYFPVLFSGFPLPPNLSSFCQI